jgi:tRNA A22 N-methylase
MQGSNVVFVKRGINYKPIDKCQNYFDNSNSTQGWTTDQKNVMGPLNSAIQTAQNNLNAWNNAQNL